MLYQPLSCIVIVNLVIVLLRGHYCALFSVLFVIPYSYWLLILFVVELELVAVA